MKIKETVLMKILSSLVLEVFSANVHFEQRVFNPRIQVFLESLPKTTVKAHAYNFEQY